MRLLLVGLFLACAHAPAQILLRINDAKPVQVDPAALAQLPRDKVALNDHGKPANYEGVLVRDLLAHNGLDLTKGLHGKQLSTVLTAIGSDGYQVVYALAEFDPTISDSKIIIADTHDGKPLGATEGPLRIVDPNDKRPARSVRMLKEIDVLQLAK